MPADDLDLAKVFKKRGFVAGYNALFEQSLGIRFEDSGVDLALLEEVVLMRTASSIRNGSG